MHNGCGIIIVYISFNKSEKNSNFNFEVGLMWV